MNKFEIKGTKLVEIPYLEKELEKQDKSDKILIVGERVATEGILQAVLKRPFDSCLCTDIMPMGENSTLEHIINTDNRVSFTQQDFINTDETTKYKYIICINVLEHFGMNFAEFSGFGGEYAGDDFIRWNHDLRAIEKMITLLDNAPKSKIIITIPAGQPIMSGDINPGNQMPFLRRYDFNRIQLITQLVTKNNCNIKNTFYFSEDFNNWFETSIESTTPEYASTNNPYSPNLIWAFILQKN
jgi:hypothetical protein